jgi:hypothetical protein
VAALVTEIWMVRHAPVVVAGVCYGQVDVATTMDDWAAALIVERALQERSAPRWDVVCCSPWQRAEHVASFPS